MRKDSKTEDIAFAVIGNCSLGKLVDLGGHVGSCAASVQVIGFFGIEWESKVDDGGLHSIEIDDDILWLDISVNDVLPVAFIQSVTNSQQYFFDVFLLEASAIVDDGLEILPRDEFGEDDDFSLGLEQAVVLADIG